MGLPIGSTSPQTKNESKQDRNTAGNVRTDSSITSHPDVNAYMHLFEHQFVQSIKYKVYHKWKANCNLLGITVHHSAIQIDDTMDNCICTLEVVDDADNPGDAMIKLTKGPKTAANGYKQSGSYKPNPIQVTGADIANAYTNSRNKMALEYDTLTNNCQKYARLLMTELGAKHYRKLFHF